MMRNQNIFTVKFAFSFIISLPSAPALKLCIVIICYFIRSEITHVRSRIRLPKCNINIFVPKN